MLTSLLYLLIEVIIVGGLFWLLWWAVSQLPAPINTPAKVIVIIIFVVVIIYVLLQVLGGGGLALRHPLLG